MPSQRCISHTAATRLETNEECASECTSDVGNATDVVERAGECMCGSYWKARPVVNQVEMHPMYPQRHLRQMSAAVPISRVTTTDPSIRVVGSEQAPDEDKDVYGYEPDTKDMNWTTYSQPKKCGAGHSGAHTPEDTHTNSTSTDECDSDIDSHTSGTVDAVATGYRLHVQAYSALGSMQGASLRTHPVIRDVAQSINRTPAQVLLRWCVQKDCGVLCQSTDADRMRENLDVFGWALDAVHVTRIDDIATGNEEGVKFCWDPGAIA
ncbi:hypothetical protein SARC_02973 [Sphaeroforma arctica JP610]|uniref:Uncharacterized protein n=1 Tax=Sphaeroforma arctica JP610 TaxID=667725 RepID=A0A0L0G721_9EUKA|nr:hypothetical protein SARC_02973 [Sphaeroforma arctica JP610]KNC84832.1 hypothetical protein SARC_02973 [Sphaeroforma arctica JP610]|eukprot:XP_014158734.1 hypothetical protein SARC_02973 [Sphaeroforma arctica JP610]